MQGVGGGSPIEEGEEPGGEVELGGGKGRDDCGRWEEPEKEGWGGWEELEGEVHDDYVWEEGEGHGNRKGH